MNHALPIRLFSLTLFYLAGMFLLHRGLPWDDAIAGWFFAAPCTFPEPRDCWLISKADATLTFWLHGVPRIIAWGIGLTALAAVWVPALRQHRQACIVLVMGMGITALAIAIMKQFTGHYCPGQLLRYGGIVADTILTHPAPRCFPAGHPSPGWGLLALCLAPVSPAWKRFGLWGGLGFGGMLSIVQMMRGEHFLSHCLATALTALFVGMIIRTVLTKN